MERIEVLIHKLVTQQQAAASSAALLETVRSLHEALLRERSPQVPAGTRSVTVILPSFYTPPVAPASDRIVEAPPTPASEPPPAPVAAVSVEAVPEPQPAQPAQEAKPEPYALRRPAAPEPAPTRMELPFDVPDDIPTLRSQPGQPKREIHELLGEKGASLNDKLKADKTELGQALKTEPIRDLRKGIGVNDRFLFISELFRGDEPMYESSIRTINAFHILPEAEYWINRELKVKLGWNDTNETVQHFYGVVRRRFS
ncbi:MAG: hypothetical protein JWP27_2899 [Flaviaesturariibacter sp.]|nr:hypothetical protein [Flaviaesturariibacter sp.]